jgi:hypothetical protein
MKKSRVSEEIVAKEIAPDLFKILPFVLDANKGKLLPLSTKRSLRLTYRAARAAVEAQLTKILLLPHDLAMANDAAFETYRRSSLRIGAEHLFANHGMLEEYMQKIDSIQFPNVQTAQLSVYSGAAMRLFSHRQFVNLKSLNLTIYWRYYIDRPSVINRDWKEFSRAKINWPLLENLVVHIEAEMEQGEEHDFDDDSFIDIGEIACLLPYLPNLKQLEIRNSMTSGEFKRFTSVPHDKLESVEFDLNNDDDEMDETGAIVGASTLGTLSEAKWPRLQNITLSDPHDVSLEDVRALLKAPWALQIKNFRHRLQSSGLLELDVAKELINGLQYGVLESLELHHCTPAVFRAFKGVHFPKLKSLMLQLYTTEAHNIRENEDFNQGLSDFFSSAKIPCLESLTITHPSYQRIYRSKWNMAPACPHENDDDVLSICPSLKSLEITGICIDPPAARFLAFVFYKRGCRISLQDATVTSGVDLEAVNEICNHFNIIDRINDLNQYLARKELYKEVYWYNLLSMDELKVIAASVFLSKLAEQREVALAPATTTTQLMLHRIGEIQRTGKDCQTNTTITLLDNYSDVLDRINALKSVTVKENEIDIEFWEAIAEGRK